MGMFQAKGFQWWRDGGHSEPAFAGPAATALSQRARSWPDTPVWVIFASETGVAEDFAEDACRQLKKIGRSSRLTPIDTLDVRILGAVEHALFLASTCDDGAPPLMAESFHQQCMQRPAFLPDLHYGLLALGDRRYGNFCAFGRQLDQWLRSSGARSLFEPVLMDNEDTAAGRLWHEGMQLLGAHTIIPSGANA